MAQYPEWSYSQSRAKIFDECLRKYYYHYYGAHMGWDRNHASTEQIITYRLKQLKNFFLVFGDLVHKMCESIIRQREQKGLFPRQEHLKTTLKKLLNESYVQSLDKNAWILDPKNICMLAEIYYDDPFLHERISLIKER